MTSKVKSELSSTEHLWFWQDVQHAAYRLRGGEVLTSFGYFNGFISLSANLQQDKANKSQQDTSTERTFDFPY